MRIWHIGAFIAVIAVGTSAFGVEKSRAFPTILELRNILVLKGAYAFVSDEVTPRTAPHIHSASYVAWIPDTDIQRKGYEMQKRDFGMAFVGELEKCAMRQRNMKHYKELAQECEEMLRTADWLKTSCGYGNYLLAHWAENLVLNMVGKMVICPEMDTNTVDTILARLGDYESDLRLRVSALNEEAPEPFSLPQSMTPEAGFNCLMRQWGKRMNATLKHYRSTPGKRLSWRDAAADERIHVFYLDDSCSGVLTARDIWDRKLHSVLCSFSPDVRRLNAVRNILRYRELVGTIRLPSGEEMLNGALGQEYMNKIDNRWSNDLFSKYGPNPTGLWVQIICGGYFVDQWTGAYYRRVDRAVEN